MIGIVPTKTETFEVFGDFNSSQLVENKLYYDPTDQRLYFYSTNEKRSSPATGFFPVWDGKNKYKSQFSNEKYFNVDALKLDIQSLSNSVDNQVAKEVIDRQRRSEDNILLTPQIADGDNMFTQCIKGVINKLNLSMTDLVDMSAGKINPKILSNYYNSLNKISFMRMDKWFIWIDVILHLKYQIVVYKGRRKLITHLYPENTFDTGIVKYDKIIQTNDDPFKKIVKLLMVIENITKDKLRSEPGTDDYTINNMMTTLSSDKPMSSQLFSRFIRMAQLSYTIKLYDMSNQLLFEYKE
jgi:hypothetical protein